MSEEFNNGKRFDSPREALQNAFSPQHLGELKQQFLAAQMVLPARERQTLSLQTSIDVGYSDTETTPATNYFVTRFIGLELLLPASENHFFRDNRAAHAATDYLGRACHIYDQYQTHQRYEHEKEIIMDWKSFAATISRQYQLASPQQLQDNMQPAYQALILLKPNYFPVCPEILSFETQHNVSRKRNIILGIH